MEGKCFFCDLGQGEITDLILENDEFFAVYDAAPANPGHDGHVLVIPKKHVVSYFDMDPEYRARLYKFEKEVKDIIDKKHNPDGYNIGINDGEQAGQVVAHLHVNIIPRFKGDGGKAIHSVVYNPPQEEISVTAERIRAAMQG